MAVVTNLINALPFPYDRKVSESNKKRTRQEKQNIGYKQNANSQRL